MRRGIRMYAEDVERLHRVNAYKERILVTMQWLITEASCSLQGLEHAVRGGASDAIVLNEAAETGHLGQLIRERDVMP
jgi:hypothetical protein